MDTVATQSSLVSIGLRAFLGKYCSDPKVLEDILASQGRRMRYRESDFLCRKGDDARCVWIVESGLFAMRLGSRIVNRGPGEIIGEQAFYRNDEDPVRGNDIEALVAGTVTIIDKALFDQLSPEQRSLWHETVANALCAKLDQATQQRSVLTQDVSQLEGVVSQFVCERGCEAAYAALLGSKMNPIAPEASRAIVWFSDLVGFSSYAKSISNPSKVGQSLKSMLDVQTAIIARAGGQIDKFIGDCVMAFWECPDDDRWNRCAVGALRAAVETADYFKHQCDSGSIPVDIRIGLHAGDVVIGNFGGDSRIAFTLIGETVNDASRFEQARCGSGGQPLGRVRVSDRLFAVAKADDVTSRFMTEPISFADKHDVRFNAYILKTEESS